MTQKTNKKDNSFSKIPLDPTKTVKVIALGGLYEIGKNTWVFECDGEIMLVDAGLAFPTTDMIGVDIVLPKLNYLVANKDKIRGMIITHGHEDHIGGVVPLLREVQIPLIYGPNLAMALLKNKFMENKIDGQATKLISSRETVHVGKYFAVTYVQNNHSIADSFSLIIDTPAGRIVHSGDFKFDHSPIDNLYFDVASLVKAGEEGVTLLISDSTNAEKAGYTPSEKAVVPKIKEIIHSTKGRTYITTFASQVNRIKLIMEITLKAGKKITLFGRSMVNLAAISKDLGYINLPDNFVVRQEDVHKIPPEELVVLTTGSQGEQFAALSRIARNEHKYMQIQAGDTVIMSASPIPGNEKSVNNLIDMLCARGADVIYGQGQSVHVSGHASAEEQKIMINLAQPKYFMPCHGEYRMLVKHGQTGVACGVDPNNIFLMDNGDVLEMKDGICKLFDKVEAGIIMVDNANVGELDTDIMLERRLLASEGLLTIVATVNAHGELVGETKVYVRGLVLSPSETKNDFMGSLTKIVSEAVANSPHAKPFDIEKLKIDIKSELHRFIDDKLHHHPLIELILMEYVGKPSASVLGV